VRPDVAANVVGLIYAQSILGCPTFVQSLPLLHPILCTPLDMYFCTQLSATVMAYPNGRVSRVSFETLKNSSQRVRRLPWSQRWPNHAARLVSERSEWHLPIDDKTLVDFRHEPLKLIHKVQSVSERIMLCLARGLRLENDYFIKAHDVSRPESQTFCHLAHYFATPCIRTQQERCTTGPVHMLTGIS
jgi:hypothetical protein